MTILNLIGQQVREKQESPSCLDLWCAMEVFFVGRYFNAWLETYTEEEFKKHAGSGTFLEEEGGSEGEKSAVEDSDSDLDQVDVSMIASHEEDESSSSDEDSSSSDSNFTDSDSFHSATDDEDSFITFEHSVIHNGRGSPPSSVRYGGHDQKKDRWEGGDSVFMQDFSDGSSEREGQREEGEGQNVLDRLEDQVMRLSANRLRM